MRTSNKWLLGFILAVVLFCFGTYGMLYSEYRKGHFIPATELHKEEFISQRLPTPRVLSFDGTIWVNLIPADSFALELPRINKDADAGLFQNEPGVRIIKIPADNPAITWRQKDDTLFVTGNTHIPIHRAYSSYYYRRQLPQVNILSPVFTQVLINNAQLYLQGTAAPTTNGPTRITIRNSTLWIGMQYENHQQDPREFFDSLEIHADKSLVLLNAPATIHHLQTTLTDSSWISDQYARIDSSVIRSSPDSRIEFSGGNLKKNQLIIR